MNDRKVNLIFTVVLAILIGGGYLLWNQYFEKGWKAIPFTSDVAQENPMLAATRFLSERKFSVVQQATLGTKPILETPPGTMFITNNAGLMSKEQADELLTWVRQGNTLITSPKHVYYERTKTAQSNSDEEDDKTDADQSNLPKIEEDPIGAYLGVSSFVKSPVADKGEKEKEEKDAQQEIDFDDLLAQLMHGKKRVGGTTTIQFPSARYPLQLFAGNTSLQLEEDAPEPAILDEEGKYLFVFEEGKGHIVVAPNNEFINATIGEFDNGEILLHLMQLNPQGKQLTLVMQLDIPHWETILWASYKYAIIGSLCLLSLLFWRAIRRFGPLLPEPDQERRSLIEHIDASGRWLWKLPKGRTILLGAVRHATLQVVYRRAPELQRLSLNSQTERMAEASQIELTRLVHALEDPAEELPTAFTRQIKTLQQLRKHYER